MAGAGDPVAVLLHGLPFPDQPNPLDQLTALRATIEAFIAPANITPYPWLADVPAPASRTATVQALLGRLGTTVARNGRFAQTLAQLLSEHERFVIIGYSAGGWIFYDWLVTAPVEQRQHVALACMLGAPYQNVRDDLYFGDSTEPAHTRRWQYLSADALAHALRPGQLHIVLSTADRTIWPENARFPETCRAQNLVRELILPDVSHRQLLTHPGVLTYLRAALAAIVS